MRDKKLNSVDSSTSMPGRAAQSRLREWVKVGVIAAASALAGGLAAAWFYRKTLNTLQNAEPEEGVLESRIPDSGTEFDI
jgi:hypothetical protein